MGKVKAKPKTEQ